LYKRKIAAICLASSLLILSACGGNNSSSPSNNAKESPASTASSAPVNADPFGKYDETVTISIGKGVDPTDKSLPGGDTPENNQYTRYIKDTINLETKIAWQASSSGTDYDQKVNLSIASNDLPDALVVTDAQLRQMVKAGQLEDLTEAYNNYASPLLKKFIDSTEGVAMQSVTFDGKMLALPSVVAQADGVHLAWVRKDWLDQLGLPTPKTVEDLEKIAQAFIDQDPDGDSKANTIGIAGPPSGGKLNANFIKSTNNTFGLDPIFTAYKAYPGFWLEGADGQTVYGSILPETKEALAKLRDLYAKGLIDKEIGIRKDTAELISSGKAGIYFGPWWGGYWPLPDAIKNNPKANWQAYAILDSEGTFNTRMGTPSTQFVVVRKGYKNPEAIFKMANLLIRDENKFDLSVAIGNYPLRVSHTTVNDIEYSAQALREFLAGSKKKEEFDLESYRLLEGDLDNIKKVKLEPYDQMDMQYWNPQNDMGAWTRAYSVLVGAGPMVDTPMNKVYSQIYSQTKAMESKWATLDKLEQQTFLSIIMGAAPIDSFDKFVEDWKKQGGDEITKEVAEWVKK
jgi:putative aldouronate transport system substrate-binding protein